SSAGAGCPAEQIIEPKQAALLLLEGKRQFAGVDPRRGDERSQTIHRQHGHGEQDTLAQVRNAKDICKFLNHYVTSSWVLLPASFLPRQQARRRSTQPCLRPW